MIARFYFVVGLSAALGACAERVSVPEIKFDSYYLYDEITDFLRAAEAAARS